MLNSKCKIEKWINLEFGTLVRLEVDFIPKLRLYELLELNNKEDRNTNGSTAIRN
jgi:hypothetical protein